MTDTGSQEHPVAALLREQGLRHDWFAEQVGVSKWMLSHYLAGRRAIPDSFYRDASLVLRVPESLLRPASPAPTEQRPAA